VRWRNHQAFTIVEMLVVIGVITVLAGVLLPVIGGIRAESRSMACMSNLRQIYLAVETYRQRADSRLPYAEPLPAATPDGPVGGLNEALRHIIPAEGDHWFCPAHFCCDYENLHTSYVYPPGAWMLLVPPTPDASDYEHASRAAQQVTGMFDGGILNNVPILADSEDRHHEGGRLPRNVALLDGSVRIQKPTDGNVTDDEDKAPGF
jgi:prepilin-type N-terminal cleavage/methylation domain-containing protein